MTAGEDGHYTLGSTNVDKILVNRENEEVGRHSELLQYCIWS